MKSLLISITGLLLLSEVLCCPPPAKLLDPRNCVHSSIGDHGHKRSAPLVTTPYGIQEKSPSRIMSAGEQALLVSRRYQEIGGNQHRKLEHLDRLKHRMLARLQGHVLVETTIRFHSSEHIPSGEVALVGSWAQWVMLHGMDKVADKVWELSINLPPGRHQFKFLVNGSWRLSGNYKIVDDNVGSDGNNVIEVHEPDQESGGEVLQQLEEWLRGVGLSGEVLDRFVEVWLWKNCPC